MLDIPQQTPLDPFATAFNGSALDFNIQPFDIFSMSCMEGYSL